MPAVDHRRDSAAEQELHHLVELGAAAQRGADDAAVPLVELADADLGPIAARRSAYGDATAGGEAANALSPGGGADAVDDEINARTAGHLPRPFVDRRLPVVHARLGAELDRLFDFPVVTARHEHPRSAGPREAERGGRYAAARTDDPHVRPRSAVARGVQYPPRRGEHGRGRRDGREVEPVRNRPQVRRRDGGVLGEAAPALLSEDAVARTHRDLAPVTVPAGPAADAGVDDDPVLGLPALDARPGL